MTFDLGSLDLHGPVYSDGEFVSASFTRKTHFSNAVKNDAVVDMFGSLSWSLQEDKVVYIAEKNLPKTAPFYQQKAKPESDEKSTTPLLVNIFVHLIRQS